MTRGLSRKELKHDEFVDAAVDLGQWLEHNWRKVLRWAGAVAAIVVVVLAGIWWVKAQRSKAVRLVEQGIASYQTSADAQFSDVNALSGALESFEQATEKAGGSATGRLARFYQGATLFRLGRAEEAVAVLDELVETADPEDTLTWSAQAMLADAMVQAGQPDDAVAMLRTLSEPGSAYPVPQALLQLARIERGRGNDAAARESLQRIVDEYPQSAAVQEARELLGS